MQEKIKLFIKKWYKKKRFYAVLIIVALVIFIVAKPKVDNNVSVGEVKLQDLESTVLATGDITSNTDLSLSFNSSGVVRGLKVQVGDKVYAGSILATLDSGSAYGSLLSAQGALASAKAKYQQVLDGASSEEVRVAEVALENAKKSFSVENARRKLFSDDLVALPQDEKQSSTPPVISGIYSGTDAGEYRLYFSSTLDSVRYSGLELGKTDTDELPKPLGTKGLLVSFPEKDYLSSDSWKVSIPNKSGQNYTANLNAYNAAVSEADSLIAARQADLDLKKAKASSADLELAQAEVLSAEGQVQSAQAKYEDTIIRAPASGTITEVNIKLGELALSQEKAIVLQDVENLYIEADINEANITKLILGQQVSFSLDSFGPGRKFQGEVIHIDPGATTDDGIVNYKIKVAIKDIDAQIKPGMNADISILINKKENILVAPRLALVEHDGKTYIRIITDEKRKKYIEQEVETGLEGDGNLVEITSGVNEGDKIAILSKTL